jgi:hypothetical protein
MGGAKIAALRRVCCFGRLASVHAFGIDARLAIATGHEYRAIAALDPAQIA